MTDRVFQRRVFSLADIQIRAASDGNRTLQFMGRAVVYDQRSDDLGGWYEVVRPGAATRTLSLNPDVRFLINHDPSLLLGRTTSGTLRLTEDADGVLVDADMADVSYARDVAVSLERGDMTQMSFGFWVLADGWAGNVHEVREFDLDGGDVSVVTYPAYPQTTAEMRDLAQRHLAEEAGYPVERAKHRLHELEIISEL